MYSRFVRNRAVEILGDTPVLGVVGPRQAGKTTLVKGLDKAGRRYLTLDQPNLLAAARSDPTGFIRGLNRATIDEIQRAPELMLAIKQSVDEDRRPGRFILTGSANILTSKLIQDSMAGRIETLQLFPLSQDELASKKPAQFLDHLFEVIPAKTKRLRKSAAVESNDQTMDGLINEVLLGGYPEIRTRTSQRRQADWFAAYEKAIIERDLPEIASIDRAKDLPQFLRLLATLNAQTLNQTEVGARLSMDRKTAGRYIELMEQLFIVRRLPAWANNSLKRVTKSPKLHFVDTGLAAYLQGVRTKSFEFDRKPLGNLLESFVLGELIKQNAWSEGRYRFFHVRDDRGSEVDIVVENEEQRLVAIEVKASATVNLNDFNGLRKLAASTSQFAAGVVLYDGIDELSFGPKLRALPLRSIWLN